MAGLIIVGVVITCAYAFGRWRRRTDGRLGSTRSMAVTQVSPDVTLGHRATLLQFSSAFCQPCVATRRTLATVAAMVDGVVHVDVDAESRLDLVRRLDVHRTPTVFVLDRDGIVVRRAVGVPRRVDVIAALGTV
jgi:hypothetical protein